MADRTQILGILNITPDSFSDGGDYYNNPQKAVERVKQMLAEGADSIDIGGESTRPGSEQVDIEEELRRIIPVVQEIKKQLGDKVTLSVDTWKHQVAQEALRAGCTMVNSLGGFTFDEKLAEVVAQFACPIIIYHIKGMPKTMQQGEIAYTDVIQDITAFFEQQLSIGEKHGVKKQQFILDPGIGFGKTVEQNITIIKELRAFEKLDLPLLIGVSRKSHLGMILQSELQLASPPPPTERLEASLAETAVAVLNGANIVRTHDVEQTKKFLSVVDKFRGV
jgi:dihydropteroate synthase